MQLEVNTLALKSNTLTNLGITSSMISLVLKLHISRTLLFINWLLRLFLLLFKYIFQFRSSVPCFYNLWRPHTEVNLAWIHWSMHDHILLPFDVIFDVGFVRHHFVNDTDSVRLWCLIEALLIKYQRCRELWLGLVVCSLYHVWKELVFWWRLLECLGHFLFLFHDWGEVFTSAAPSILTTMRIDSSWSLTHIWRTELIRFYEYFICVFHVKLWFQWLDASLYFSLLSAGLWGGGASLRLIVILYVLSLLNSILKGGYFTKFANSLRIQLIHTFEQFWT